MPGFAGALEPGADFSAATGCCWAGSSDRIARNSPSSRTIAKGFACPNSKFAEIGAARKNRMLEDTRSDTRFETLNGAIRAFHR